MADNECTQLKAVKYFTVYIDCPLLKYCKELAQQIEAQSEHKYLAFCSGPALAVIKSKIAGKEQQQDLDQFKTAVLVDMVFEEDDLEVQKLLGNAVDETFFADKECTRAVLDAFKTAGFNVVSINGSYITPYSAAQSVIAILDQLNQQQS